MNSEKYIGLDVHQATISVAVMDSKGKIVMESILETVLRGTTATGGTGIHSRQPNGGIALYGGQDCHNRRNLHAHTGILRSVH